MDRRSELVLSKEGGEGRGGLRNISKGCDGFIDRSKVRILLCDNDSKSSDEVFKLLCGCAYQGIVVDTCSYSVNLLVYYICGIEPFCYLSKSLLCYVGIIRFEKYDWELTFDDWIRSLPNCNYYLVTS